MIETSRDNESVRIAIGEHYVVLGHARADLMAGRLERREDITVVGQGGSLVYRSPLFGADSLAIADRFLDRQAVRVELDDLTRGRLVKVLRSI